MKYSGLRQIFCFKNRLFWQLFCEYRTNGSLDQDVARERQIFFSFLYNRGTLLHSTFIQQTLMNTVVSGRFYFTFLQNRQTPCYICCTVCTVGTVRTYCKHIYLFFSLNKQCCQYTKPKVCFSILSVGKPYNEGSTPMILKGTVSAD
jgi:hypothetical protein